MRTLPQPLVFFFLLFAGWVNRKQASVIDYLKEENRPRLEQPDSRPVAAKYDGSKKITGPATAATGSVRCHNRLAGMLNFYYREAA